MTTIGYDRRARDRTWLVWPIVILAALARLAVVDRDAFWLDEGYTWWDARQPLAALWSLVPDCDPHPPLYFALMHGWIALVGDGTVAMRLASIAFGAATVAAVFMAGRELGRMRGAPPGAAAIAPLAALCFAVTPFQMYFSIEARPYALLCLGAALATWGALRLLRLERAEAGAMRFDDGSRRPLAWLLLVAGTTVALWTNNTAVLFVAALSLFFVASWLVAPRSRVSLRGVVAAGIVIALLWAPDLPLLLRQSREVAGDFWIPKPTLAGLNGELRFTIGLDAYDATWWIVLAMAGGLLLVGSRIGWRTSALLAALAIVPVALNVAISALVSPILIARALIAITPAFVVALAAAAALARGPRLRAVLIVALLAIHGAAATKFFMTTHMKEPWRPVVARLAQIAPGTPVLVVPNELALPLAHAAKERGVAFDVRGLPADYPAIGLPVRYPSGKCAPTAAGLDAGALRDALVRDGAVVLVTRWNNSYDRDEDVPAAVRAAGFVLATDEVHQPGDLRLMRYVRAGPSREQERSP